VGDDPFDLSKLRVSQNFLETTSVKKLLTTVPIRKPGAQDFIRVHPSPKYRETFAFLELKEDREVYIVDLAAVPERYSRLDMYAMGLATDAEVPPWFFIDSPVSTRTRETPPIAGITINGTRRDVLIQDVIAALGPRVPSAGDSPRVHRQAFVFIRRAGSFQDPQDLTRLRRIREQWPAFFTRATENRMTVRTSLSQ
jgi:hypothetical protein